MVMMWYIISYLSKIICTLLELLVKYIPKHTLISRFSSLVCQLICFLPLLALTKELVNVSVCCKEIPPAVANSLH